MVRAGGDAGGTEEGIALELVAAGATQRSHCLGLQVTRTPKTYGVCYFVKGIAVRSLVRTHIPPLQLAQPIIFDPTTGSASEHSR